MSTLRDWLYKIKEESEKDEPQLGFNYGRLVSPGFEPLDHQGFIRLEAQGIVDRAGSSPEALSVSQWFDTEQNTISDLPSLISASLTLLADRRIEILPEIANRIEGTDRLLFLPYSAIPDKRLISPSQYPIDDGSIRKLFTQVGSLSTEDDRIITQALSLHYASVLLFDKDLPAAYALLVAGLEALSSRYGDQRTEWSDWDMAEMWDAFIKRQKLNDQQAEALRAKLIKDKKMRLGDTFAKYVSSSLPKTFWTNASSIYTYSADASSGKWAPGRWEDGPSFSKLVPEDRDIVYKALRKSYEARSNYVHEGKRSITPQLQIAGLSDMMTGDQPVPFALLRTMLTSLIKLELANRATTDFTLPDIRMTHGRA